jgi:hypothetical protein
MPNEQDTEDDDLRIARLNLTRFVECQARDLQRRLGFGWCFSKDAPATFEGLLSAYEQSLRTKHPFPISPEHCDNTVFVGKHANGAMRFWHDCGGHARTRLTFSISDELELAQFHLALLNTAGFVATSLAYRLLHADTVGQTRFLAIVGAYPENQLSFDLDCVNWGVPAAIEAERQRLADIEKVAVGF